MSKKTEDKRDPKDRRRKLGKGYWSTTVRSGDVSVYAWENLKRGGFVFVKFASEKTTAKDGREKKKLPGDHTVRDDRGRLDSARVERVEKAVGHVAARLALGEDPFAPAEETDVPPDVMTVRRGFRIALDLESGKFAAKTRRYDEVARARTRLERLLGPNTPLAAALDMTRVKRLWRDLARAYADSTAPKGKKCGARQTEVTIDALYTVADWLQEEGHLPSDYFKRIQFWREKLKEDWKVLTGEEAETAAADKLRHSEEEMRRLFGVLEDPRRRLFNALRRRVPEGALADARWSGLAFDGQGMPQSITVHWLKRVRTPGVRKADWATRPASQVFKLEAREQHLVAAALSGHLRLLELARAKGILGDYHLFPEGALLDGAVAASATTALTVSDDSVLALDERFELAFELGGEQRMGQVIRSTRRNLTLPGVDRWANDQTPKHGVLLPPRARKKETEPIALTEAQRAWVEDVLEHGYLHEYEAAFRAGRIADYPLFVAERMPRGVASWQAAPKPLSRDAALKMFHRLEAIAGVEQIAGRGWYGVRRVASDVVEDVESDERVQDLVLANTKGTRKGRYQHGRRPKDLARASDVRVKMRAGVTPEGPVAPATGVLTALRAAGIILSEAQIDALSAALSDPDEEPTGTDGA